MAGVRDVLNGPTPQTRRGRVEVEGSPEFDFDNPSIAASAAWVINLEANEGVAKYLPLDFVEVSNDQPQDVELVLNDVRRWKVLGHSYRQLTGRRYAGVKLVNLSPADAIAAGTIRVTVYREGTTADTEARRRAAVRAQ